MPDCTIIDKLRGPKILDMSIFDWFVSLGLAVLVGYFFLKINALWKWLLFIILWTLFGVVVHWIFGIKTMLGFYLGINKKPSRKHKC
jgi:uncharacterized membrane protein YcaP (DUF421 family)